MSKLSHLRYMIKQLNYYSLEHVKAELSTRYNSCIIDHLFSSKASRVLLKTGRGKLNAGYCTVDWYRKHFMWNAYKLPRPINYERKLKSPASHILTIPLPGRSGLVRRSL
jgi:hypothetical protein